MKHESSTSETPTCPICNKNKAVFDEKLQDYRFCDRCISETVLKTDLNALKINSGVPLDAIDAKLECFIEEKVIAIREASNGFKTNILLYGESGVGKTFLISAIINYCLCTYFKNSERLSVRFYNVFSLMSSISDYSDTSKEAFNSTLQEAKRVDILVLDEMMSDYNQRQYQWLYDVLNFRKENKLTTYFSSNVVITDARIMSRIRANNGVEINVKRSLWNKKDNCR